jgi:EAL domain-containing protein (putative c-di-GMP-specific phosphodiesterase class I)
MSDQAGDSKLGDSKFRDALAGDLRELFVKQLKDANFVLYYQPIVPAAATTAESSFREILVRYREEEADLLPPGSFLPILEEQGFLPLLDRWVVGRLLKTGRDMQAAGKKMPHCSVNLSIDTVRRDDAFGEYVLRGLQKMNVSAASLTFEIMTSDALLHPQAVAKFIPPLRAAGITFALSWFAGEESALELAPKLGISFIKIDGSLAIPIARDPKAKARLAALVQHCRKLGMRTVCMLVEDAETLDHLRAIHVDYVQGFGIGRPRPLEGE